MTGILVFVAVSALLWYSTFHRVMAAIACAICALFFSSIVVAAVFNAFQDLRRASRRDRDMANEETVRDVMES